MFFATMAPLQASRLGPRKKARAPFFADSLPEGSLLRAVVFWGIVPLIGLAILVLIVDSIVLPIITRHGTEFPVPDFVGQKMVEARMTLIDLELGFEIASEEYSPGKEKGLILGQFPIGGTKVKSGRAVKFVVSLGQKMVPIPDVAGLSVRQARLNLETAGLTIGDIAWAFSDTLPEKMVVVSYPPAGTEVTTGAPVTLMVNRGRSADFTYVPRLVGLTLDEAQQRLADKQLVSGIITRQLNDQYLPETVLEQSVVAGSELEPGTEIDMVISITE
jgi:serine/threonine-protein kinase